MREKKLKKKKTIICSNIFISLCRPKTKILFFLLFLEKKKRVLQWIVCSTSYNQLFPSHQSSAHSLGSLGLKNSRNLLAVSILIRIKLGPEKWFGTRLLNERGRTNLVFGIVAEYLDQGCQNKATLNYSRQMVLWSRDESSTFCLIMIRNENRAPEFVSPIRLVSFLLRLFNLGPIS